MASPLPLETLLAEPLFRSRVVVAGAAGLRGHVSWCLPASEVDGEDEQSRAGANDLAHVLVHVAARRLVDDEDARALVIRLARRGAAALLVRPGHQGRCVDLSSAAAAAEEVGMPLVLLPPTADFRSVAQLVATKALAQEAHVLEYSARVHRTLGEVFAHGSGLPAMARTMSQLSGTPVHLLGLGGEVLASADTTGRTSGPVRGGTGPAIVAQLIAQHRDDRARAEATSSTRAPHARAVELELGDESVHAVVAPVSVAGDPYGVVVLVEPSWPVDEHDLAQHVVIAEQGATLVGSELLRQRSVREAEERARDDFVDALLHGRFTDQHELAARARHYGFDPEGRFVVFVLTGRSLEPERRVGTQRAAAATRAAAAVAPHPDRLTLTALIGSMIVVIRELPDEKRKDGDTFAERQRVHHIAEQLHRAVGDRLGDGIRVAYGRPGVGAAGVAGSYRQARTAVALAHRTGANDVCGYDDLRVFAAIEELAASPAGQGFAEEVLRPLRTGDGQTGNLEQIVLAYVKESGNLNAAARALRLHRNTMLYKLDRASRALGMDIRTADAQFMVWLAHHIDALHAVHAALDHELLPPA